LNWQDNDLLIEHYDRIKRYIAYRAGSNQAEDLTQQVFLKANQALDSFQNKSSLYTWLYSIATNTIINEARRSYRTKELLVNRETNCSRFMTTDFTKEVDFKIDLGTSLNKLDPIDQEILTLRYVADYSFRDIAKLLKMNEGSLKNRMYRCLGKMRNDLESWHIATPFNPKQYILMVNMLETGQGGPEFQKVTDDFMAILRKNFRRITSALNYTPETKITYEIYPDQETLSMKVGSFSSKLSIGNAGVLNLVRVVSPLNPGPYHNYHSVIESSLGLYTMSLTKQLNLQIPRILLYGIASYIGQPRPRKRVRNQLFAIYRQRELPSISYLEKTSWPQFLHAGGINLCFTIIDFFVTRYGWEALHRLIRDFDQQETICQLTPQQLEADWRQFVMEQYINRESNINESSSEVKHLSILVPDYQSHSIKFRIAKFIESARAFEFANPGVKVTIDSIPLHHFYNAELPKRLSGPNTVDLVFGPYNSGFSRQGLFADLFPFYKEDGMTPDDLYKPLIDMVTENGEITAIPMSPQPLGVFYNKEWFIQAKLSEPTGDWTWEQFFTVSAKLKEANSTGGKEIYGSVVPVIVDFIESLAQSGGGSLLSPDNRNLTGYLDSRLVADVFDMFLNPKNNPDVVKISPDGTSTIITEISSGNVGMGVGRLRNYPVLTRDLKLNGKIGVAPLPRLTNGVRANVVLIEALSIVATSSQQQLAWKFIKDIVLNPESEFQKEWSKREMLGSKSSIQKLGKDNDPGWIVGIEELDHAVKPIMYRNPRHTKSSLASYIQDSTSTLAEIQSLLSQVASKIDKLLAEEE
jgi:RNA polymerase sigma-70 factor (ECF subfamily)